MLVARAAVMLLTTLGMALVGKVGVAGTLEDPVFWHEQGLRGVVTNTRVGADGIALSFASRSSNEWAGPSRQTTELVAEAGS